MSDESIESEYVDREFRPDQPAITPAMRKRIARAWVYSEMERDLKELDEKETA